ncbi:MAG: DNA polymerase III subunit beta, partial [Myxococcota bacterium]|nr:DNA polymerase III subunit beta [Myxococcota bacterium]
MDLYIDREELTRALGRVQSTVERRGTNLALAHVLLSANESGLRMTATDTMVAIVADYEARIEEPGELSVDAQSFFQIAKALPEPTVHLRSSSGNRLEIVCGRARFHVVGLGPEDFPPLPARDDQAMLKLDGSDLRRLLRETEFAVSQNDSRIAFNGAHLEEITAEDGQARIRFVTTDGNRLCWSEAGYDGEFSMGREMLLPKKVLDVLGRLVAEGDTTWEVGFGPRSAVFQTEGLTVMVRLVDGQFPEYRRVLPSSYQRRVMLSRRALSDAMRRVAIVASDRNHSVRFAFEGNELVLTSQNVDLGDARRRQRLVVDLDEVGSDAPLPRRLELGADLRVGQGVD